MKRTTLALTLILGAGLAPVAMAASEVGGPGCMQVQDSFAQKKVEVVFVLDTTGSMSGLI